MIFSLVLFCLCITCYVTANPLAGYAKFNNFRKHYGAQYDMGFGFANKIALQFINGNKIEALQIFYNDEKASPPFQMAFQSVLIDRKYKYVPIYSIERSQDAIRVYGFPSSPDSKLAPVLFTLSSDLEYHKVVEWIRDGDPFEEVDYRLGVSEKLLYGINDETTWNIYPYRALYFDLEQLLFVRIKAVLIEGPYALFLGFPSSFPDGTLNVLFKAKIKSNVDTDVLKRPFREPFNCPISEKEMKRLVKEREAIMISHHLQELKDKESENETTEVPNFAETSSSSHLVDLNSDHSDHSGIFGQGSIHENVEIESNLIVEDSETKDTEAAITEELTKFTKHRNRRKNRNIITTKIEEEQVKTVGETKEEVSIINDNELKTEQVHSNDIVEGLHSSKFKSSVNARLRNKKKKSIPVKKPTEKVSPEVEEKLLEEAIEQSRKEKSALAQANLESYDVCSSRSAEKRLISFCKNFIKAYNNEKQFIDYVEGIFAEQQASILKYFVFSSGKNDGTDSEDEIKKYGITVSKKEFKNIQAKYSDSSKGMNLVLMRKEVEFEKMLVKHLQVFYGSPSLYESRNAELFFSVLPIIKKLHSFVKRIQILKHFYRSLDNVNYKAFEFLQIVRPESNGAYLEPTVEYQPIISTHHSQLLLTIDRIIETIFSATEMSEISIFDALKSHESNQRMFFMYFKGNYDFDYYQKRSKEACRLRYSGRSLTFCLEISSFIGYYFVIEPEIEAFFQEYDQILDASSKAKTIEEKSKELAKIRMSFALKEMFVQCISFPNILLTLKTQYEDVSELPFDIDTFYNEVHELGKRCEIVFGVFSSSSP